MSEMENVSLKMDADVKWSYSIPSVDIFAG